MDNSNMGLLISRGEKDQYLIPKMCNRHGLIAGATGTGKTVSLQVMAEKFSSIGVPVFLADVKGDLSGLCRPGEPNKKVQERIVSLKLDDYAPKGLPVTFWDVFGEHGHPVRTTISEMGPILLSRILDLNETQSGIMNVIFKVADDNGLLLLDLKDLRAMLEYAGSNRQDLSLQYGNITPASVATIQRKTLVLEEQGADKFFGEPALDIFDLIKTDHNGMGMINILSADKLLLSPKLYSTFLLWLLSELFEGLPEIGDPDRPRLVFFFDEAHLLFNDTPKFLMEKIEQVVRLIRSKGVGVFFITQNPLDVPDIILGQLGNRVQHALRAYTERDLKAVRAAAETFRINPSLNVEAAISELGVGEALVSFLDEQGRPNIVERSLILPPQSLIGPITENERHSVINRSLLYGRYEKMVDRDSAYEHLQRRFEEEQRQQQALIMQQEEKLQKKERYPEDYDRYERQQNQPSTTTTKKSSQKSIASTLVNQVTRGITYSIGRQIGTEIARGVMGSLFGKRK